MKTNLFKIKNYHPVYIEDYDMYSSISSFRLDLREGLKKYNPSYYFSKSLNEHAKNKGCYLFGQPDAWKGVIGITWRGDEEANEIVVYVDNRNAIPIEELKEELKIVLKVFKDRDIINDYEVMQDE